MWPSSTAWLRTSRSNATTLSAVVRFMPPETFSAKSARTLSRLISVSGVVPIGSVGVSGVTSQQDAQSPRPASTP